MSYHELTQILRKHVSYSANDAIDKDIRAYLTKRAQKLRQSGACGVIPFSRVYPILGLKNEDDNWCTTVMQLDAERETEYTNFVNTKKCDKCEVNGAVNCPDHGIKKSYSPLKDAECEHDKEIKFGGYCVACVQGHCKEHIKDRGPSVPGRASGEWCKHQYFKDGEWRHLDNKLGYEWATIEDYKFCGWCGAPKPRPEKRRALAEILYDVWNTGIRTYWKDASPEMKKDWENISDAAIEWFSEVVKNRPNCACSEVHFQEGCIVRYGLEEALKSELAKGGGA